MCLCRSSYLITLSSTPCNFSASLIIFNFSAHFLLPISFISGNIENNDAAPNNVNMSRFISIFAMHFYLIPSRKYKRMLIFFASLQGMNTRVCACVCARVLINVKKVFELLVNAVYFNFKYNHNQQKCLTNWKINLKAQYIFPSNSYKRIHKQNDI